MIYFAWDPLKAESNLRKHGITFDDAASVFDDPSAVTFKDRTVEGEQRWQTFGMFGGVRLLMVAHTLDLDDENEYVRIISARRASRIESRRYEIKTEQ